MYGYEFPDQGPPSPYDFSGDEHRAIIASTVKTCRLCRVDPQAYLADVLTRIITGHLNTRLNDLLPGAYAATPDLKAVA